MKKLMIGLVASTALVAPAASMAATMMFDVMAKDHALKPVDTALGTGIMLNSGDAFSVSAALNDYWSLGSGLARSTNADGDSELSGAPEFGMYSSGGSSFYFGQLVGRIDNGAYFGLGTNFAGTAASSGELFLLVWDSNDSDNSGSIEVTVNYPSAVPLPASSLLLLGGLGALGAVRRKARKAA